MKLQYCGSFGVRLQLQRFMQLQRKESVVLATGSVSHLAPVSC